ncbi:MAG: GGDEF domain-containing protein [Spirochaetes bacterium]|nr:GGDEF domain-containing protein [Spirochaetota bacterium]
MGLHESKVELLRFIDIFSQLREYELDIIARYSDFVQFRKGSVIFNQGLPAEELYVVEKGRVGIISVEDRDDNIVIAQIIANESFGEFDFFGRTYRSATALAEEDSILLKFPGGKYNADKIFQEHSYISAQMLYRLFGIISERIWHVNQILYDKTQWVHDLHRQLLCDKMTGLYNKTFLEEDFVNLLNLGNNAAFIMIKPDNFKEVNDNFGHDAGDQVLNLMAIFLQSELGENDIGIRYRGDEFAAILPSITKEESIEKAKNISRTFKSMDLSRILKSSALKIEVSIGIAMYPADSNSSAGLVEKGHSKMNKARNSGGNRINI